MYDIYHRQEIIRAGPRARRADHPERGLRAGDDVRGAAARHLLAHHRHRHRAHGRERVLRARGQHAHALRRLLHAGEPGSHDAHVPGAVQPQPRGGGGGLSGQPAPHARERGPRRPRSRADRGRCSRPASTTAPTSSTRSWPTRWAWSWSRARTSSSRRRTADEDHAGPQAGRRGLPARRRRLPRPARSSRRIRCSACPASSRSTAPAG